MKIFQYLEENKIDYGTNIPLSSITGMNVSGSIPLLAKPDTIEKLRLLYLFVINQHITYEVIGGLTNTYLCGSFKRDIVIQTTKVKDKILNSNRIIVGCGYGLTKLSRELCQEGIEGYEGFVGIPGTVGAAAINNSGAFSSVMSDVVHSVVIADKEGCIQTLSNKDLQYTTRNSNLKKNLFGVLLSVELDISRRGNKEDIEKRVSEYTAIRKKDIDGNRKSLGSIITGNTVHFLWKEHRIATLIRKILYLPFKHTRFRKKAQCITEFFVLGGLRFVKHCDNLGRFCWTKDTRESDFFDYLRFVTTKSNNKITLEIDIKE